MLEQSTCWLRNSAETAGTPGRHRGADSTAADPGAALLIDVRSEQEFRTVALEGALNLPLPRLETGIRELADPGTPLVLYCASGARSAVACMALRQMGYQQVTDAGGLFAAAASLNRALRP